MGSLFKLTQMSFLEKVLQSPSSGHVAFRWTLDTGHSPGSPDHSKIFQNTDIRQSPNAHTDYTPNISSGSDETEEYEGMLQDWSEDDITDLLASALQESKNQYHINISLLCVLFTIAQSCCLNSNHDKMTYIKILSIV